MAKCSIKNLKHNFRGRKHPFTLRIDRRKETVRKKKVLTRYDQLINYFYEPIKTIGIVRDKFMSFLKIDKNYRKKNTWKEIEKTIRSN